MRKIILITLVLSTIFIIGCSKTYEGKVGETVDIYIEKKPINVLEYKWAFKNKPIESRLDPRDFIPSDYAETVTFIPDVPGNYEIMVVMIDDHNKEFDKTFKYVVTDSDEFISDFSEDTTVDNINEISQDDVIQTDETEKISNEQEDDVWEDVPSIPQNEKKHSISSQKYTIQFSSSHNKEFSEIAVTDLRKLGYDAYIKKSYLPNDSRPWYRVRVGNYSYSEAKSVLRSLERRTNQKGIWIDKK